MKTSKDRLVETKATSEDAMQWADDYMKRHYSPEALQQMERDFEDWFKKVQSDENL